MAKAKANGQLANSEPVNALAMFGEANSSPLIPLQESGGSSPYVVFFWPTAKNAASIKAAFPKVQQGQAVYINGNDYVLLDPFSFLLCPMYFQYYATFDTLGEITQVQPVENGIQRKPFEECIDALLIVINDKELLPARIRFKGPKCPAMHAALRNINDVMESADWEKRHRDHQVTAKAGAKLPKWSWVEHETTLTVKTPKNGESKPYDQCDSTAKASSAHILLNLSKCIADSEFSETLKACGDDLQKRIEELKRKVIN